MDEKIADRKGYEYMRKLVSASRTANTTHAVDASKPSSDVNDDNEYKTTRQKHTTVSVNNPMSLYVVWMVWCQVEGSISGSTSTDVKQTTQYLKDKFNRSFR